MSRDTLTIPRSAVAAAGRALKFTIEELSEHQRRGDLPVQTRKAIGDEIMEMMDANKAMFSAAASTESADLAELQARLIRRTEEATATAYRDAETIRRLRDALQTYLTAGHQEARAHAAMKAKAALAYPPCPAPAALT